MGELERKRSARDLFVSRGHLWAMAAGTIALAGTCFVLGFTVGHSTAPSVSASSDDLPDEQLVELLARVEASRHPQGGTENLTFPDALAGRPVGDPFPDGQFTLELAQFPVPGPAVALRDRLRAASVEAWVRLERVDGEPVHHVEVGAYPDETSAAEAMKSMSEVLAGAGIAGTLAPIAYR